MREGQRVKAKAKTALITGAAKRVGAVTAKKLHSNGYNVVIHYGQSASEAEQLVNALNEKRKNSAVAIQADLSDLSAVSKLSKAAVAQWGGMHALINNASAFYPTPLNESTIKQWDELFNSNAKAPYFLAQSLAGTLAESEGAIVNMVDIHATHPLKHYNLYGMSKAALAFMTKSLAKDLAPHVRVNGIAPGMVMWPDEEIHELDREKLLRRIPLKKSGTPDDIANAIAFLVEQPYITGQILAIDGGRSLMVG